jgi:pimeloyl-ACP methyl ester carboxylesterase
LEIMPRTLETRPEISGQSCFAYRDGIPLHYVVTGTGPPLLLVHGIPDFWNGWRHQIEYFKNTYQVVSVDLRGVNLSGQPRTVSAYRIIELVRDTIAVLDDLDIERANVVGHDWGAIIAWWVAMLAPRRVAAMAALSAPHPACYLRAKQSGRLHYPSDHLDQLVTAGVGAPFNATQMTAWVADSNARAELIAALLRSDVECLRNFYRANLSASDADLSRVRKIKVPVLAMYGTTDPLVEPAAYRQSAEFVSGDFQVIAIPGAGHFIHYHDADRVNVELEAWLASAAARFEKGN